MTPFNSEVSSGIRLLIERSPEDKRDYIAESIFDVTASVPPTLDLTLKMPPVRDQGSQGSCAAMAAAAVKEWQENADVSYTGYMSPQFIYNLRSNAPGEGMYTRDLMKILNKNGVVIESMYPYGTMSNISESIKAEALKYVVKEYALVTSVAGLRVALASRGPCVISLPVYNYGLRMWNQEPNEEFIGGHAMTVVGYNHYGFLIRNSWSSSWGVFGHTLFPYSDWGKHWEVWTTLDADSPDMYVKIKGNVRDWLKKTFNK